MKASILIAFLFSMTASAADFCISYFDAGEYSVNGRFVTECDDEGTIYGKTVGGMFTQKNVLQKRVNEEAKKLESELKSLGYEKIANFARPHRKPSDLIQDKYQIFAKDLKNYRYSNFCFARLMGVRGLSYNIDCNDSFGVSTILPVGAENAAMLKAYMDTKGYELIKIFTNFGNPFYVFKK